ncbi:unnamed protein product [Moneuplotes crassus]|uniref:Uncharacterized protein n=1 Tax=Euplotes crassus TaxID=5936 RepID=A0AAD2D2M8_EUPCR|nr:unnamed protein product [Moneuplotes crassus]
MVPTCSDLKWTWKRRKTLIDYELQQQAHQLEKQNLDFLDFICYNRFCIQIRPELICLFLDDEQQKQILKKIVKLGPQLPKFIYFHLQQIKKRGTRIQYKNYCIKMLNQIRGSNLKSIRIGGDSTVLDLANFSFYARSVLRLASMMTILVQIKAFKISHKHFGRILMSCNNTQQLCFRHCQVNVDNLDYLDHVGDTKDTRSLIKHLCLEYNTFIQPEEDSENLDGLVQKMAKSRLNTGLHTVTIRLICRVKNASPRKEYKLGNFNVTVNCFSLVS